MLRLAALVLLVGLAACGPSDAEQAEACAKGVPEADAERAQCKYLNQGRCFDDATVACTCEGCQTATCSIGESFPAVALCN